MSTFLIGLVVVAATVLVIRVALSDPDQPATIRRPTGRDRPRRSLRLPSIPTLAARLERPRERAARSKARPPAAARLKAPPEPFSLFRRPTPIEKPVRPRRKPARGWVRVRSGMALLVLVTFVGVLMAVTMGTGLALAARALRQAVG